MEQKIFFNTTEDIFPDVILADKVFIPSPNCHFTRKPSEYILYFITEGKMQLKEDLFTYTLNKGDCILLDPARTHSGIRCNSCVKYFYIHFKTSLTEQQLSENDFLKNYINRQNITDNDIKDIVSSNDIIRLPKITTLKQPFYEQFLTGCNELIHIMKDITEHKNILAGCKLLNLFLLLEKAVRHNLKKEAPAQDIRVFELINYIKKHYNEEITSEIIAKRFYNNYDYLNRIFKKTTGKTIFAYLNEYRITESKRLLHSGFMTNREIADAIGFHNEFYYSKVFKQYTGISPRDYKKMLM